MKRKTLQIEESVYNSFNDTKKALNMNSSETLGVLLSRELIKTETTIIQQNKVNNRIEHDKSDSFNSICSNYSKKINKKD